VALPNIVGAGMEPHPITAAISGIRAGRREWWGLAPERAGAIQLGLAMGIALLGSIGVAVYRGLLATGGEAFTDGLQLAAAVSAVALAGVAVAAAIVLRRVGAGSDVAADFGSSTTSELAGQS